MTRHYLHYVLLYYAHIKQTMRDEWNSCIGGTSNSLNPPSQNIWSSILLNNVRWPSWSYYVRLQPISPQLSGMWLYFLQKASNRNIWLKIEQVLDKEAFTKQSFIDFCWQNYSMLQSLCQYFLRTGWGCREIKA